MTGEERVWEMNGRFFCCCFLSIDPHGLNFFLFPAAEFTGPISGQDPPYLKPEQIPFGPTEEEIVEEENDEEEEEMVIQEQLMKNAKYDM